MKRRISLENDFMDLRKDDKMYIYLACITEYKKEDGILWLDKQIYYDCKEDLMKVCGYKSPNSLRNNMKKWIDCGLIEEGVIEYKYQESGLTKKIPAYIFKNYDEIGKYQLVELEMLKKLVHVKNKHSIQIYVYLLSKYVYKKRYEFTLKELKTALNYSEKTKSKDELLNDILEDLYVSGYIKWEVEYKEEVYNGHKIRYPVKILNFVAQTTKELPQCEWLPKDWEEAEKNKMVEAQNKFEEFKKEFDGIDIERIKRLFRAEQPNEYEMLFGKI